MSNNSINQVMGNRTAIKYNQISINETGKVSISRNNEGTLEYGLYEVKSQLLNKDFDNIINVLVSGPNGCIGPDFQPSKKAIKRLLSIIKGTSYKVVAQNKFDFVIEGEN